MKRALGLLGVDLALLAAVALWFPQFARPSELADILDDTAILIILAIGQMPVLLTRGVDLSVASIVALSGMAAALADGAFPGLGVWPAIGLATALGTALGAANGLLVWRLGVPPIVATLGTMAVFRGLVFLVSGGEWVTSKSMSAAFLGLGRAPVFGVSALSLVALAVVVGAAALLRFTRLGRGFFAAGGDPQAAAYAGVDVGRAQFAAFVISGALAGLCGCFWVARFAVAYTDVALGFELQVIAACVIGGVSIRGGSGLVTGVLLGALFLGVIKNALPLVGVSPFWQTAVSGLVIVVAVALNSRAERTPPRRILEEAAR